VRKGRLLYLEGVISLQETVFHQRSRISGCDVAQLVCLSCYFGKKFVIWWRERRARVQGRRGLARGQVLLGPTQLWHSSGESCCDSWHFWITRVNESLAPGASSHPPTACASGSASVRSPVRVCQRGPCLQPADWWKGRMNFRHLALRGSTFRVGLGGVASVLRRRTLN
jgi:hypothetical protein